jgi:hypothetical protein
MALVLNTTVVSDGNGIRVPSFASSSRPASPVQGQVIYNTTLKALEVYDGGYWNTAYDSNRPFLYRTIITTSYVCGGYKDSTPWLNANRMTHSTDVCTNLGNQLPAYMAYVSGACSLTKGFAFGSGGGWSGATNQMHAFNMATETSGGYIGTMRNSRDMATVGFAEHYFAYIGGGGTGDIDVFNLTNETMYQNNMGPDQSGGDDGGAMCDETAAYMYTSSGSTKLYFATVTGTRVQNNPAYTTSGTDIRGAHGQQRGISTKVGKGYAGNEGSWAGGYNLRRFSFATDVQYGTSTKPIGNSGEENFDMGQDKQYMFGCHNGAQNNLGWRFNYASDSGYEIGAGSVRTGVPGGSSGVCFWKG